MRLKIAIIGPSEGGKTTLANFLANENPDIGAAGNNATYRPTDSVRIVELSIPNVELKRYSTELDIQLWEVGGNPGLKTIWPAVQRDLDGVVVVYNVHNEGHIREASALHMHFVTHSPTGEMQCFIVGNTFRGMREIGPQRILGVSKRVRHIAVNLEDESNAKTLMNEFMEFITGVAQIVHEREKSNIVGMKTSGSTTTGLTANTTSKKLTSVDLRNETLSLTKMSKHRRSISTAVPSNNDQTRWGLRDTSRTKRLDTAIHCTSSNDTTGNYGRTKLAKKASKPHPR